jgi:hypothetical protein
MVWRIIQVQNLTVEPSRELELRALALGPHCRVSAWWNEHGRVWWVRVMHDSAMAWDQIHLERADLEEGLAAAMLEAEASGWRSPEPPRRELSDVNRRLSVKHGR